VVYVTRQKVYYNLHIIFFFLLIYYILVESKCRVEVLKDEYIRAGGCVSFIPVGREQCAGGCESQESNV
jgi:hypothetical protein